MAIIAAASTAVSAGVAAYESHEQGVAVANADKRKARVEQDNAQQQQITMRQNMLRALATQNAAAGALGGRPSTANSMRQITAAQNDIMISKSNSSAITSLLDQAGRDARSAGDIGAAAGLVSGVGSAVSNYYGATRGPGPSSGSNSGGGPG